MVLGRDERPQLLAGVAGNGAEGAVVRAVVQHDAGCGAIVDRKRARVRHVAVHARPHIGVRQARVVVPDVQPSREVDDAVTLDGTEGTDRRRAEVRGVEVMHCRRRDVARHSAVVAAGVDGAVLEEIRSRGRQVTQPDDLRGRAFLNLRTIGLVRTGSWSRSCRCRDAIRRSKGSSTRCRSEARSSCPRPSCPWSRS